ncbi:hypothetical protein Xehl_03626 [Xenorhabdus ehlersii]|uniref:Uncharacterized protein n=1 Tax=Xenorhabdus ehlersii TaxID=290111 RepID=A0A2D0IL00_9GAMM|nr:hypothetical protein Xehl_03626 [Xenorhabdus ehlersii]
MAQVERRHDRLDVIFISTFMSPAPISEYPDNHP